MSYAPEGSGPTPGPSQSHQPGPYAQGQFPHGYSSQGAAANPAVTQAAWRYSARRKNDTTAWLLWIGGPFMIGLPVHDFYFGSIGKGLAKLGLLIMVFVSVMGGVIFSAISASQSYSSAPAPFPGGFMAGLVLAGLCFLALTIWWIYDGVTMTKRLETTNERIRQEIAAEQGIDPWDF